MGNKVALRLLTLRAALEQGRHTLPQLAARLGTSQRTIRRDLAELIVHHGVTVHHTAPVDREWGSSGEWWIP